LLFVKCILIYPIHAFGVELRDLRYFISLADNLDSLVPLRTSALVNLRFSRQIKSLENELGVLLFDRIGRRTVLTAARTCCNAFG
jgi:LysR family transcriptional regulator, cyn operon transcriptional activator